MFLMGMFLMRFMFNGSVTVSFKTSMSVLLVQRACCLGGGLRPPAPPCNLGGATAPGPPGPPGEKSRAYGESVMTEGPESCARVNFPSGLVLAEFGL